MVIHWGHWERMDDVDLTKSRRGYNSIVYDSICMIRMVEPSQTAGREFPVGDIFLPIQVDDRR
jgi:hypothetical protein